MERDDPFADPSQRWDKRWSQREPLREPADFVVTALEHLPSSGAAIDVAGGTGRHALLLAELGLEVTLVDVSQVALDIAGAAATVRGVGVGLVCRDLETDGLPAGRWDVAVMYHFYDEGVLRAVVRALEFGGTLVFCQPTVRNRERHDRPGRRFLLEEGELARIIADMPVDVVLAQEGWGAEGRHEARLVARKRTD
jgi:SAM-dependent methyltransferase